MQSVAPTTESYTQTMWRRKVNTSTQYNPPRLGSVKRKAILESESMATFVKLVHPIMEEALQERDAFDIFRNAFPLVNSERGRKQDTDDAPITQICEHGFNELGSFIDTEQKQKVFISAISWVPKLKGIVAISMARNVPFEQCVGLRNHGEPSYISLWDIKEPSKPILKLASPHDVLCFHFNSSHNPSVVIAGLQNGQVAMWGIKNAIELGNYHHIEGSTEKHVDRVHPVAISDFTSGHKKSILDMSWLPSGIQVNCHGNILGSEHIDGNSYQFITVAADGLCMFWDIRYQEIAKGHLPHISRRPRASSSESQSSPPWIPLFSLRLNKLEGTGHLALSRLIFSTWKGGEKDEEPHIVFGTEEGEIVLADWRPKPPPSTISTENGNATGTGSSARSPAKAGVNVTAEDFLKWVASDNVSSCVTLRESPFFKGIVLSAGNWTFKLWRIDCRQLVFTSPMATACISTARWSPTRPGVILVGKVDGSIDMWDFADTSLAPIITFPACSSLITAMEFINHGENESPSNSAQQILAIGDSSGHLHVNYVPEAFSREVSGEFLTVNLFLSRNEKKEGEMATETNDKTSKSATQSKEINNKENKVYDSPSDMVFEATKQKQVRMLHIYYFT